MRRGSLACALVAVAAAAACVVEGNGSPVWRAAFVAVGLAGVVAVVSVLRQPGGRILWTLVALAQLGSVAGYVLTHDYRRLFGAPLAHPWAAQLPSLLGYGAVIAAVALVTRARARGDRRPALVDALVVATPAAAVSW